MAAVSPGARGLIAVSIVGVGGLAAWYGRSAWEDSGAFAVLLFGIPLACAAAALWAETASATPRAPMAVALLGAVSVVWSLLTIGGLGLGLLLPSLLLLVAAVVSWTDRGRDRVRPLPGRGGSRTAR